MCDEEIQATTKSKASSKQHLHHKNKKKSYRKQVNYGQPTSEKSEVSHVPKEIVENTVFVGNLPKDIDKKKLKILFRTFGPIISVRLRCAVPKELKIPKKLAIIKKDFHPESTHVNAFVRFENLESCRKAVKVMNGRQYQGHCLRVTLANDFQTDYDPKKAIFLGNLPLKLSDDSLWTAFEDCGAIDSVRVIRDKATGLGKGFGYVNFKSADSVELAMRLDGQEICGRDVRVRRVVNFNKKRVKVFKPLKNDKITSELSSNSRQAKKQLKNLHNSREKKVGPSIHTEGQKNKGSSHFQGQKTNFRGLKTKRNSNKKVKRTTKNEKKKLVIRQIAEGMKKK